MSLADAAGWEEEDEERQGLAWHTPAWHTLVAGFAYSTPLVLGTPVCRASIVVAIRRARAEALKIASAI